MLNQRFIFIKIIFLFLSFNTFSQKDYFEETFLKTTTSQISLGGYFRFLNYHRHVTDLFGDSTRPYVFS